MESTNALTDEFIRLRDRHREAMQAWVARAVLGSSVIRVFRAGTKDRLLPLLQELPVHELPALNQQAFADWYGRHLERIARRLNQLNTNNRKVQPGLKWGHAAKILSLYLRDITLHTRYFNDEQVTRISRYLPVPVDGVIIRRLRSLGFRVPFRTIREIDSRDKFSLIQDTLAAAARTVGTPAVWFDDNWAERVPPGRSRADRFLWKEGDLQIVREQGATLPDIIEVAPRVRLLSNTRLKLAVVPRRAPS